MSAPGPKRGKKSKQKPTGLALELQAAKVSVPSADSPAKIEYLAASALAQGRYRHPVFSAHVGHREPPADVVFAGVCNDKYAPGLEGLILSLLSVYPSMKCKFIVYHDSELSAFSRQRLLDLYPYFDFRARMTDRFKVTLGEHGNHKRVGLLGYLSLEALEVEGASHVVILDTDLLVLGDISPLWSGNKIKAVPDIGAKPFGILSAKTGKMVINSGVLSFPASELGPATVKRRDEVLAALENWDDPDIERFADQRFWNAFLSERDVQLLPQNFNCVKTLLEDYFPDVLGTVAILHITGPKPWFDFANETLVSSEEKAQARGAGGRWPIAFGLWTQRYVRLLLEARLGAFVRESKPVFDQLRGSLGSRPVALVGNGPSINKTDLTAFSRYEKVVFNWFVNFAGWDEFKPDHLIVASHMIFGGWFTARPQLPPEYLQALTSHAHKPRLWFPYYFKHYVEGLEELKDYAKSYIFFEKPFKEQIAKRGTVELDLEKPLIDSNTGVITAGMPLAVLMGAKNIVLAGCDSNYTSTQGSYFYASDKHASATTRAETLTATWAAGGEGLYGYSVALRALHERGIELFDATIDGKLDMLPKLSIEQVRKLGS